LLAPLALFVLAAPLAHAQDAKSAAAAADTYKTRCAPCHLPDGNAPMKEMNLADSEWKHGSRVADLVQVISEGVPGTAMLSFKAQLSEQEIAALAAYVRSFDKTLKPEKAGKKKGKSQP
jgi:mono/diheme cytochrome c family protein